MPFLRLSSLLSPLSSPDFRLIEAVDLEKSRLAEAQAEFGCRTFTDFSQFLRRSQAELVVIATQSMDHAPMSIAALAAGKHVLSEKPMATSLRQTDRVLAAAGKSKGLFTVHQNARLAPDLLHIKQVMKTGVLGDIFMIKRGQYSYGRRKDWQTLRKYGGGNLLNNGVHAVDQVLQLLDSPVKAVFGDLQRVLNPGDREDHVKVVIRAESGMIADVEVSTAVAISPYAWMLLGTKGSLISDGRTSRLRYHTQKLPRVRPVDKHLVPSRDYDRVDTIQFIEKEMPSSAPSKRNFYDYLYDSIRKSKPLLVSPESVRNTMYVLDQARKGTLFT
ncbi:MAG: Gfo/Idh/MocA family protein [Armatimonadota bacterium]